MGGRKQRIRDVQRVMLRPRSNPLTRRGFGWPPLSVFTVSATLWKVSPAKPVVSAFMNTKCEAASALLNPVTNSRSSMSWDFGTQVLVRKPANSLLCLR